jgi:hypothetical protein
LAWIGKLKMQEDRAFDGLSRTIPVKHLFSE